jgi:adenine-specific DNA-methyltransferase
MSNISLFQELEQLLRPYSQYTSEDGIMLKNSIVEAALQLRPDLLKLILSNEKLKANFFTEVESILVFDKLRFQKFVMNKRFLPDSYTSFKNKIGLTTDEGDFLADSREVVLSWPYKDCVLEGGQTKEDAKRNEVFWNEILAPDEINRLSEPKVLTNFKKYDADGEHLVKSISKVDNLIIKGNNLLALHSLKKNYAGQVKLIYIDPPYNTGNDSFQYNDSFNHSAWLTFMRNRLTVAKELLRHDGIILIQCDDNEQAYLKVLMDELFGLDSFVNTLAIRSSTPSGTKTAHKYKTIIKQKDYIHIYKKSNEIYLNPQYSKKEKWDTHFNYFVDRDKCTVSSFLDILIQNNILSNEQKLKDFNIENKIHRAFYIKNANRICQTQSHKSEVHKNNSLLQKDIVYFVNKGRDNEMMFYNGRQLTPLLNSMNNVYSDGHFQNDISVLLCDFWSDIDFQNTQNEGGVEFPTAKKPELLMYRLIDLTTQPNDIILDYHLGSGTTAAVAHKMNRRYIGIEQMDYIETVAVERLKKVIGTKTDVVQKPIQQTSLDFVAEPAATYQTTDYDQGGISKAVNWKGGGSFVYCELAKANQDFAERILSSESKEELTTLWQHIQETGFLSWKVNPKQIDEKAEDFAALSVEDTQKFLLEALDKNLLYIPYSEIDNQEFGISTDDKRLNAQFYGKA